MSKIIGIDLGTTNSAVGFLSDEGPKLIPNSLGSNLTPSVVAIDSSGKLLVGAAAKELRVTEPDRCASVFKRHMGNDWSTTLGDKEFNPIELSSLVLASLKADAEAYFREPVKRAVITVPAYFNDRQRQATIAAGHIAGLKVERILNEPTAAAIAYGFHESDQEKTLLIYDLGGGTFDVSLVDLFDGTLEVKASAGEQMLGGEDFTRTLTSRLLDSIGVNFERAEMEAPLLVSRLLGLCETAKTKLSKEEEVEIKIPNKKGVIPDDGKVVKVTREQMLKWIEHILARLELPVRRVLSDSKIAKEDIAEVILVGGATRMPVIYDRVTRQLGKNPHRRLNPDEVVALGASVQAGLIAKDEAVEDMVVTDVAPFTLGIEVSKRLGNDIVPGYFTPVIHRNTTIPVSRTETVETLAPNQNTILVKVYQGESRKTKDNLLLGELKVPGIPPGPPGQLVEIRFTYDLNGVLEVEATVVATKRKLSAVITKHAKGGMSKDEIQRALEEMKKLKTHPREESVNRFLLRRAERLYAELGMNERDMLSELLDGFESALASQDREVIDKYREALKEFLDRYDPEPNRGEDS